MLVNIKKNYFILIYTFLLLYFIFNLFDGERGLISYFKKKNILIELNEKKNNISNKIKNLEKKNYFILIYTFLLLYFIFNLFDGERGLISYFKKKNILVELNEKKINLSNKIKNLENKNSLLTDNLDLDYIETLIREKFLFGKDGEKIYIKKNEN